MKFGKVCGIAQIIVAGCSVVLGIWTSINGAGWYSLSFVAPIFFGLYWGIKNVNKKA